MPRIRLSHRNLAGPGSEALYELAKSIFVEKWKEENCNWLDKYAPRRTGALRDGSKDIVNASSWNNLYIGSDVDYASYPNENSYQWTNLMTKENYYQQWQEFAERIMEPIMIIAIRESGLAAALGINATAAYQLLTIDSIETKGDSMTDEAKAKNEGKKGDEKVSMAFSTAAIFKKLSANTGFTRSQKTLTSWLDDVANGGYVQKNAQGKGKASTWKLIEKLPTVFTVLDDAHKTEARKSYESRKSALKGMQGIIFAEHEPELAPIPEPITTPGEEGIKTNIMTLVCKEQINFTEHDTGIYSKYIDAFPDPSPEEFYRVLDIVKNEIGGV
jgi:hypothetical protein